MTAKTLDHVQVGEAPANAVALMQLDNGTFQVVLALMPPEDEWETGSYPPPDYNFRDYTNEVEARGWFKIVARMLEKMGPPGV